MTKQTDPSQATIGAAASMFAIGAPFFTMGLLFDHAMKWVFLPIGVVFLCIGAGSMLALSKRNAEPAAGEPDTDVTPR